MAIDTARVLLQQPDLQPPAELTPVVESKGGGLPEDRWDRKVAFLLRLGATESMRLPQRVADRSRQQLLAAEELWLLRAV